MAGNWTKLTIEVNTKDLDRASAVVSMLDNGLMIEDYSDFSLNGMYGELVDESILKADRTKLRSRYSFPRRKISLNTLRSSMRSSPLSVYPTPKT